MLASNATKCGLPLLKSKVAASPQVNTILSKPYIRASLFRVFLLLLHMILSPYFVAPPPKKVSIKSASDFFNEEMVMCGSHGSNSVIALYFLETKVVIFVTEWGDFKSCSCVPDQEYSCENNPPPTKSKMLGLKNMLQSTQKMSSVEKTKASPCSSFPYNTCLLTLVPFKGSLRFLSHSAWPITVSSSQPPICDPPGGEISPNPPHPHRMEKAVKLSSPRLWSVFSKEFKKYGEETMSMHETFPIPDTIQINTKILTKCSIHRPITGMTKVWATHPWLLTPSLNQCSSLQFHRSKRVVGSQLERSFPYNSGQEVMYAVMSQQEQDTVLPLSSCPLSCVFVSLNTLRHSVPPSLLVGHENIVHQMWDTFLPQSCCPPSTHSASHRPVSCLVSQIGKGHILMESPSTVTLVFVTKTTPSLLQSVIYTDKVSRDRLSGPPFCPAGVCLRIYCQFSSADAAAQTSALRNTKFSYNTKSVATM